MASSVMLLAKPFVGDPRVTREARSLAEAGHEVTVLSWNRDGFAERELKTSRGSRILMVGPKCQRRSLLNFMLRLPLYWFACLRESKSLEFSIVHAHDFDTLPISTLIGRLRGAHLLYDAHESYADMISEDAPGIVGMIVRRFERWLVRRSEEVIVADAATAPEIGAHDATIVLNCPSSSEIPLEKRRAANTAERLTLGYFGTFEGGRFVLEAAEVVTEEKDWRIIVAGSGSLREPISVLSSLSESVEYRGTLPHDEVMGLGAQCDAMHVILDPSKKNYVIATPLRLFEAMSLGVPPIVADNTCSAELVRREKCGFICRYDRRSLRELLRFLSSNRSELSEKGERGRKAFEREYNWERQVSKLLGIYSAFGR